MKDSTVEMAWNEPKDRQGENDQRDKPTQGEIPPKPKREEMPDLDVLLKDLKNKILGKGGSNQSNDNHNNDGNRSPKEIFQNNLSGKAIGIGFIAVFVLWLLSGFYIVNTGTKAVVLFMGKVQATTGPGVHWRFPKPLGSHQIVDVSNRFSASIGGSSQESMMLTKDEAIVDIRVEVQYEIDESDPARYLFVAAEPDKMLRDVVESALRERVGQTTLDAILTSGREQLMADVKRLSQNILNMYDVGLEITNLNLVDAQPPQPVQKAFTDAIRAREDEQRKINQAETYVTDILARIKGEVERELADAEGYKQSVIAKSSGEAKRFTLLNEAYLQSPVVTRERLYLDAMESVFSTTNKVLMNTDSNNLMVLPLDQLLNGAKKSSLEYNNQASQINDVQNTEAKQLVTPATTKSESSSDVEAKIRSRRDIR